jgi:hypothetical protein
MGTLTMSRLDRELSRLLDRRRLAGVSDIKCHVEVTSATEPEEVKQVLVDVLTAREDGALRPASLRSLRTARDLDRHFE